MLELDSLLPARDTALEAALHFPVPASLPDDLFGRFSLELPSDCQLHPAAVRLLQHLPQREPGCDVSALMLYTDGSYKGRQVCLGGCRLCLCPGAVAVGRILRSGP